MHEHALEPGHGLTYEAADGHVGRLRLPGGLVEPGMWTRIAELAELGDGNIHLTTRGNLRIRGIAEPDTFSAAALAAGFTPGATLIATPLARLDELVTRLDQALAGKTGHDLLVGIDDGSGDVLARRPDLGLMLDDAASARLIIQGEVDTDTMTLDRAVAQLVDLAPRAHARRSSRGPVGAPAAPIGWLAGDTGSVTLAAGLKFGLLEARVARMLDVIEVASTVTPDQGLLIHDLSESVADQVLRVLAPLGLIFNENSPWLRITACISAPGCRHARDAVRRDATQAAAAGAPGRLHFVGCSRNCGRPTAPHTLFQATGGGEYEVIED